MFQVFDCGKPADSTGFPDLDPSWDNSTFDTFEEAQSYAWKYLGPIGGSYDGKSGITMEPDVRCYYYGETCWIEIRTVQ